MAKTNIKEEEKTHRKIRKYFHMVPRQLFAENANINRSHKETLKYQ